MPQTFYNQDSSVIDPMMYSKYIKYEEIAPYTKDIIKDIATPKILNIFIDLYSMITPLFKFYRFDNPLSLTACMANAAIHYRNYFRKLGFYSNIFLIYSPTMSHNNLRYCPEYNNYNIISMTNNRDVSRLLEENLELVDMVCRYLPDIFFRQGTVEVPVIITDMISKFNAKNFHTSALVISSSPISFQIPCICSNAKVLYLRRSREVLYVDNTNALNQAALLNDKKAKLRELDQSWVAGYYTLCAPNKRSMSHMCSTNPALKILAQIYANNETLNTQSLYEHFMERYLQTKSKDKMSPKEVMDKIYNRFMCLDFNHQLALYRLMPESSETGYLSQLQDLDELYKINDTYFRSNPINLDMM